MDPVLLASGSDDSKVKIWSTTQKGSVQTIETRANVCSVKWNPHSSHQLAFGSADHHIHYYDLRKSSEPLYLLTGHKKAVSYVKFLNRNEIVSASTDSTLRLWSLNGGVSATVQASAGVGAGYGGAAAPAAGPGGAGGRRRGRAPRGPGRGGSVGSPARFSSALFPPLSSFIETNLAENILTSGIFRRSAASILSLTKKSTSSPDISPTTTPTKIRSYSGHTNEKNFVGLSINATGDFISCGSENNSVCTYYNSLPTPVIQHRFGNGLDIMHGEELADPDPGQFVSSVCWKRKDPSVLVAANSVGSVKVMQL
ncbi:coatomer subunit alpha, partial [Podochytrium sp. JEL0797]